MILATLACLYKLITKTPVVIDRHTTFLLGKNYRSTLKLRFFKLLHRFTIRTADLTIVTNEFLAHIVTQLGGKSFVLPDKLPEFTTTETLKLKGRKNVLLISSFGRDEPMREALEAMETFDNQNVYFYITGNHQKLDKSLYSTAPPHAVFTGFLSEQDFINILFSVDVVIVLTTSDYCMLCGCYEAVSATKPLITSNKEVLREYFKGAVFVDNTAQDISEGMRSVLADTETFRIRITNLKETLTAQWKELYRNLESQLSHMVQ